MVPVCLATILFAALSVNINTLWNGFVYDDKFQILKNRWITDIGYVPDIFSQKVWGFSAVGSPNYYRPMMHLIYMIGYSLFGPKAWGFHLINLLLHCGVSLLVFLVVSRLLQDDETTMSAPALSVPLIAGLLFAVHPIHAEAVAWIAGVPEISFTLFSLLSFYFFLRGRAGCRRSLIASLVSFFLATLSKETGFTLLIIFFAYDWTFRKSSDSIAPLLKRHFAYLAAAGLSLLMRVHALGGLSPGKFHQELGLYHIVMNVFPLFGRYLTKLLVPSNPGGFYVFNPITSIVNIPALLSLAGTVAFAALVVRTARRDRVFFTGLLFIAVPLVPSFYIRAIAQPFAERYLYLPSFGFVLVASLLIVRWTTRFGTGVPRLIIVSALIAVHSFQTIEGNAIWRDSYRFWSNAVSKAPGSFIAHLGLGNALLEDKGLTDDAIKEYETALSLSPENADIRDNLGYAFFRKGQIDRAVREYETALTINPRHTDARCNLGLALFTLGDTEEALAQYREASREDPSFSDAHHYMGIAYERQNRIDLAIREFEDSVRLEPANKDYRHDLARAYARRRDRGTSGPEDRIPSKGAP